MLQPACEFLPVQGWTTGFAPLEIAPRLPIYRRQAEILVGMH
jgi:hypothetical protein